MRGPVSICCIDTPESTCEDRINGFGNEEPQRICEGVQGEVEPERKNLVSGERVCRVGSSDARGV